MAEPAKQNARTPNRFADIAEPAAPEAIELTILMPCLNEAETLAICIQKAKRFLDRLRHLRRGADRRQWQHRRLAADRQRHGRARRAGAREGLWRGAARRHRRGARPLHHHGRCRRFLRFRRARRLRGAAARRRRTGDGQSLRRRHRGRRHAAAAPLSRQSGAELPRPAVLPGQGPGFPLRAARLQRGEHPGARPADHRHGVRQRDGRARRAGRPAHRGSADHAEARRPQPPAASEDLARRLAASQIPADVQSALAVLHSRPQPVRAGRAAVRRCCSSGRCKSPTICRSTSTPSSPPASWSSPASSW